MANKLTLKQEKFVQELIKGKSQRDAYKAAYKTDRMTDKSIDELASRLFKQVKVMSRYNELKDRLVKDSEDECIISAKEIVRELTSIAFDDIKNYLDFKTVKTVVGYDEGEPIFDYKQVIEFKDTADIDTKNISEISLSSNGTFKFKMHDRFAALYKLAELFGLNEMQRAKQKLAEEKFEEEKNINSKKYW
ncbi:terminase small subunit [Tissierella carlieri]|uniref:terminase small subunit n=1 Tax=Tissierella carlieri TaxID=689904 RepID=UPI001C111A52|nr:terminase small subunit [Tissierella carlieri]MBU5312307.1 terminase small subunit [Tissierella carlieri]